MNYLQIKNEIEQTSCISDLLAINNSVDQCFMDKMDSLSAFDWPSYDIMFKNKIIDLINTGKRTEIGRNSLVNEFIVNIQMELKY